jgi:hypothetical protein
MTNLRPPELPHFGELSSSYRGQGYLTLADGEELPCHFDVGQFKDADLILVCRVPFSVYVDDNPAKRFRGTTDDGAYAIESEGEFGDHGFFISVAVHR